MSHSARSLAVIIITVIYFVVIFVLAPLYIMQTLISAEQILLTADCGPLDFFIRHWIVVFLAVVSIFAVMLGYSLTRQPPKKIVAIVSLVIVTTGVGFFLFIAFPNVIYNLNNQQNVINELPKEINGQPVMYQCGRRCAGPKPCVEQ